VSLGSLAVIVYGVAEDKLIEQLVKYMYPWSSIPEQPVSVAPLAPPESERVTLEKSVLTGTPDEFSATTVKPVPPGPRRGAPAAVPVGPGCVRKASCVTGPFEVDAAPELAWERVTTKLS
jgi:hypothetical protein